MSDDNTGAGGEIQAPFYAGFQDAGVKTWAETKGYKDPESLATSAFNLEKLLGADRAGRTVVLPKDDTDAEGIKAFRAKLGVPEKADDYKLPVPEGMDPAFATKAASWFHAEGVPPAAARKIGEAWNAHIGEMITVQQTQEAAKSQQELDGVKAEWGEKFDANAEMARRYLKSSGLSDEQVGAMEGALGTATFLKTFQKLGASLGEAGFTGGDTTGGFNPATAEVNKQMQELRQQRVEEKITQQQYEARMDQLRHKLAA